MQPSSKTNSLDQWFTNLSEHQNQLEDLLKRKLLGSIPRIYDSIGLQGQPK